MKNDPLLVTEDDVERVGHPEGMDLARTLERQGGAIGELSTEQPARSLERTAGEQDGRADHLAGRLRYEPLGHGEVG